ncbi:MAG: GTPase, partial [Myxococcota bacterium]
NAGKSTLLNTLVNEQKALVHHTAGTTRDVIEAPWQLDGIPITLVDVAGLRDETRAGHVERMGMQQAHKQIRSAHVILWLVDASTLQKQDDSHERTLLSQVQAPIMQLLTKADLCPTQANASASQSQSSDAKKDHVDSVLRISAQTGQGMDALHQHLRRILTQERVCDQEPLLTNEQQFHLVQQAQQAIAQGLQTLKQNSPHEVAAALLREAGQALDELLGSNLNEDVLETIFSRFCIGK